MPRRTIRLTAAIDEQINSAAKLRGYSSPSAFLRAAIKKELGERAEGSGPSAEQIVGSIRGHRHDIRRLERAQQASFALLDSLAKAFFDLRAGATWGGPGDRSCGRAKPPRTAAHECWARHAK